MRTLDLCINSPSMSNIEHPVVFAWFFVKQINNEKLKMLTLTVSQLTVSTHFGNKTKKYL